MSVVEDARHAMSQPTFELPPHVPVVRWDVEEYETFDHEPALKIFMVVDESVDEFNLDGHDVGELKSSIREALQSKGITLSPYLFLA